MTIQIPALGRDVRLGMLFDCQQNEFLDSSICDENTAKLRTISHSFFQSNYDFTSEDTISEKTTFLGIQGSAKLSLLCGAVELRGSLKYLEDHRKYTRQARVYSKLSCRTHFNELYLEGNSTYFEEDIHVKNRKATHFISGIEFGVDAVMIFEQIVSSSKNLECSRKDMETKVMRLVSNTYSTEYNQLSESFSSKVECKYYGDIELEDEPKTFDKAVNTFKNLASRISQHNAIPMTIWLSPLSNLPKQRKPFDIATNDTRLVKEVEDRLENFQCLKRQCNDILKEYGQACKSNHELKEKLIAIKSTLVKSEHDFKSDIARSVKDFTAGSLKEHKLSDVIQNAKDYLTREKTLTDDLKFNLSSAQLVNSFIRKVSSALNINKTSRKPDFEDLKFGLDIQLPCIYKSELTDRQHNEKGLECQARRIQNLRKAVKNVLQFYAGCSELSNSNFVFNIKTVDSDDVQPPSCHELTYKEKEEAMQPIIIDNNDIDEDKPSELQDNDDSSTKLETVGTGKSHENASSVLAAPLSPTQDSETKTSREFGTETASCKNSNSRGKKLKNFFLSAGGVAVLGFAAHLVGLPNKPAGGAHMYIYNFKP